MRLHVRFATISRDLYPSHPTKDTMQELAPHTSAQELTEMNTLRARGLSPSLDLHTLMEDLREGRGFALLFKDVVRTLGQESARFTLKRHGYQLGANVAPAVTVETSHSVLVQGFMARLQSFLPQCTCSSASLPYGLEWECTLGLQQRSDPELLIDQENALLWVLTGFAAGYLHQVFGHYYHISYARQPAQAQVRYAFFARWSADAPDVDGDVLHASAPQAAPGLALGYDENREALARTLLGPDSAVGALMRQVAPTDATVLLMGQSGVGKSLAAGQIHAMSLRAAKPWVEINCAALPEQLIESELFGVERGAFSGATFTRKGKFEQAHGGSIFLDEIGLLSPAAQSKLLRVLQSGQFEKLGSNLTITCDVRVIAATNENLKTLVREGKFREDLYYRLHVFPVTIPSLLERKNDLPIIASAILQKMAKKYRKNIVRCNPEARQILFTYDWPGNIRELENALERAVIVCPSGAEIQPMHLGITLAPHASTTEPTAIAMAVDRRTGAVDFSDINAVAEALLKHRLGDVEQLSDALVRVALQLSQGHIGSAAHMLGMSRAQLSYKLKKSGIAAH